MLIKLAHVQSVRHITYSLANSTLVPRKSPDGKEYYLWWLDNSCTGSLYIPRSNKEEFLSWSVFDLQPTKSGSAYNLFPRAYGRYEAILVCIEDIAGERILNTEFVETACTENGKTDLLLPFCWKCLVPNIEDIEKRHESHGILEKRYNHPEGVLYRHYEPIDVVTWENVKTQTGPHVLWHNGVSAQILLRPGESFMTRFSGLNTIRQLVYKNSGYGKKLVIEERPLPPIKKLEIDSYDERVTISSMKV